MEGNKLKYWLAFNSIGKMTARRFKKLLSFFNNDLMKAWEANQSELVLAKIEEDAALEIVTCRQQIEPDAELAKLEPENIGVVTILDGDYPRLLKEIPDAPPLLYYRGDLAACRQNSIGVVGARKYSLYGQRAVGDLVGQLTRSGLAIISGLALGIDALAHEACLKNNGLTVGVLGSGVDRDSIYPSANRYLAKKIINSGGCLLSEYPLGTMPTKYTFPQRNRIIAGLSLGTLVIEAASSSGALITAKCALEYNREVFAVPGSIYNRCSAGCNHLVKAGAKLVQTGDDVLDELRISRLPEMEAEPARKPGSIEEEIILNNLCREPLHIDKLSKLCNIKINVLAGILMLLEMKSRIKNIGGQNYVLIK